MYRDSLHAQAPNVKLLCLGHGLSDVSTLVKIIEYSYPLGYNKADFSKFRR